MVLLTVWTIAWFTIGILTFVGIKMFSKRQNRKTMRKMFKKDVWDD